MKNTLLIEALHCRNKKRAPIWIMRQAGRYMPEYRALRLKYSFLEMCHNPELIAQVTQLPLQAFGMDAAILFSDILVIPEALGMGLHFDEGLGPIIDRPLNSVKDVESLPAINMKQALSYVSKGIHLLRPELNVPLIGFCGAPFTLASYMIEGKSSKDLLKTKKWMFQDPISFHLLLEKLTNHCVDYLEAQIESGVEAVQIFDTWAGMLAHTQFHEFSLKYLEKIIKRLNSKVPIILFCKGSSYFASDMAKISPNALSIDWNAHLPTLRKIIPSNIALQGNLDPDILYASHETIKRETRALLDSMKGDPGYVFNLGHGITPLVPIEGVKVLVDTVKNYI